MLPKGVVTLLFDLAVKLAGQPYIFENLSKNLCAMDK
jgi:hypothetical protein